MATTSVSNTLNSLERTQLRNAEAVIHEHIGTFVDVGRALAEIRDNNLYRETHKTFERYIADRWDFERRHAYRLIAASEVVENVSNWTQKTSKVVDVPTTESQARELAELPAEQQGEAWEAAVEKARAEDKHVTAEIVREVVESLRVEGDDDSSDGMPDVAASVLLAKNTDKIKPTREQLEKLAAMPEKQQNAIMRAVEDGKTLAVAIKESGLLRDSKGKVIPISLQPAWNKALKFDAWSRQLSTIAREIKEFCEDDKRMGAYLDVLTLNRDIRNCKHALKFAKPYVVCPTCKGDGCNDCRDTGWMPQTSLTRNAPSEEAGE